MHELASTLTSQLLPAAPNGTSNIISNLSIVPPNPPQGSAFAAGEILYPDPTSTFSGSFIYTSNRNTGNQGAQGDAITIFSVNSSGTLTLVGYVYTGLNQIRGMQLFGPNSEFLIAGGYGGGGVAVFKRTGTGEGLTLLARNTDLPTRSSFVSITGGSGTSSTSSSTSSGFSTSVSHSDLGLRV